MADQLHIIVAGDTGRILRLPFKRKKLNILALGSATALLFLTITSISSVFLYKGHLESSAEIAMLQEKISASAGIIAENKREEYQQGLKEIETLQQQLLESSQIIADRKQTQHSQSLIQIAELQKQLLSSTTVIDEHKRLQYQERLQLKLRIAALEKDLTQQAVAFKKEKESILAKAVNELNERSELIEQIVASIGIKLPAETKNPAKNSGGLFIPLPEMEKAELIDRADQYLHTIRRLPFGRPINGKITSYFGKRKDPVNNRTAFHEGIDLKGRRGDKIRATADGVVIKTSRGGAYGNFLQISHGNGYTTSFSHMQKFEAKKGDKIKRGQVVGRVGNTGRTTGPHLHYEILLNGRPVNPYNFMKIAKLAK